MTKNKTWKILLIYPLSSESEVKTQSEQLLGNRVTTCSLSNLFLEQFWLEFTISLKSRKPVSKTNRPENGIFWCFKDGKFFFFIS